MDHQQHNNNLQHLQELDNSDQDDAVSLCDLPIDDHPHNEQESSPTAPRDSFDFSFTFNTPINNTNQTDAASNDNDNVNNNFSVIGKIRPLNPFYDLYDVNGDKINKLQLHSVKSKSSREPETGSYRLNYSSCSFRKHMVFIGYGLAKIPTKMELSDIKKRQNSRRNPAPMFPAVTAHGGGNVREPAAARRKHHWVLLANVLAKATAFTCVSPPFVS